MIKPSKLIGIKGAPKKGSIDVRVAKVHHVWIVNHNVKEMEMA